MPHRLKLIVAYDGAAFAGWQSQTHRKSVQDYLEHAFRRVIGKPVRVHGAGRTDAGVHALGQCAHVDLANRRLSGAGWTNALNALLPPTIRVLRCRYMTQKFHARFSVKRKIYRYHIWAAPILPPSEFGRAWHVPAPLDFRLLEAAAAKFVGTHNFAAFAARRGKSVRSAEAQNAVRTIHSIRVRRRSSCITIEFDGSGFLYKMVRLMVGAMVRASQSKMSLEEITIQLRSGAARGPRFVAPAQGLFLVRVWY